MLVQRLAAQTDTEALGRKWTAAIVTGGPNYFLIADFPEKAALTQVRNDVRAWTAIARDLVEFAHLKDCGARKLYVELWYDC